MVTALKEICDLRTQAPRIDTNNSNRYCILSDEGRTMTAYCFSIPVYNDATKRLVRREFIEDGDLIRFSGSNTNGFIHHGKIVMTNVYGGICISLPADDVSLRGGHLYSGNWELMPSFNGVCVHCNAPIAKMNLNIDREFLKIRHCSKSFGIMQEEFLPFFTATPLFSSNENKECFPATVEYKKGDDRNYEVIIRATQGNSISFELNLYEPKLFQDTTVESRHPKENNAYGGISFLGKTEWTGEQWLYSRLDLTKIPELYSAAVQKVFLHLPRWNNADGEIEVYAPTARFCSFGSNWENKIGQTALVATATPKDNYLTVDITRLVTDASERCLIPTEGLILKPKAKEGSFVTVSTGDNYTLPQILEVQYEY